MLGMQAPQIFDWLVSVVNFAVMFVGFKVIVIDPMGQAVRLREQRVRLRLQEIDRIATEAKAKQEEYEGRFGNVEEMLAEIKATSERTLAQAKTKVEEKAESEERYLLEKAEAEAVSLRREVELEIRSRIAKQAIARAETILSGALDASAQNAIFSAGVKKVGELSAT